MLRLALIALCLIPASLSVDALAPTTALAQEQSEPPPPPPPQTPVPPRSGRDCHQPPVTS
jgi:hypothetical protein